MKNELSRFKAGENKLWGIYRGVVEDRDDPLRLGRVRVRIWGVHTEEQEGDINKAPWEELQWAQPVGPNFEGSISGSGAFCVPLQGAHVFVFFENGNLMQPRYFGTAPGFPVDGAKYSQIEKQDGFRDPYKWYPLDDHIEEHDWQRLARIDKLGETYLAIKEEYLDKAVPIAFGGEWNEQPPMYDPEYPDNNVFATHDDFEENIVVELDSTFGSERIAWWHPSRSYMEVNFEGRMTFRNTFHRWDICDGIVHLHYMSLYHKCVSDDMTFILEKREFREIKSSRWTKIHETDWRKVLSDSWETIEGNEICYVAGNRDEIVNGNETYYIAGTLNHGVEGDYKEQTDGNKESTILGNMVKYISGNYNRKVVGNHIDMVDGDRTLKTGGIVSHKADSGYFVCATDAITMHSDTQWVLDATGKVTIQSGATIEISAPTVNIQTDVNILGKLNVGGDCTLGGKVALGGGTPIAASPSSPAGCGAPSVSQPSISTPAEPPDAPTPPGPDDPPDFVPPDEPVEMPDPGC